MFTSHIIAVAVMVMVCGRHCLPYSRHGLWPSLLWPSWSWFVAVVAVAVIVQAQSYLDQPGIMTIKQDC